MYPMDTKACKDCGEAKPKTDFYKAQNECKECTKARVRANYRRNKAHYQEYERHRANLPHRVKAREDYAQTEEGKAAAIRAKAKWLDSHALERAAHIIVGNSVRDGRLIKPDRCSVCQSTGRIHGHHEDYEKPLEVIWLCSQCHTAKHGRENPCKYH